ncbi:ComEC family competence protein [Bacteroidales bacterium OttesenSCG-928-M11]|nr:ComEC family competence protein [Bacteroidales bacterium OttesenSCG-928-M11]
MPKPILREPFSRLILFFISGIVIQYHVDMKNIYPLFIILSITLLILSFISKYQVSYSMRWIYGIGIAFFLLFAGSYLSRQAWKESDWEISSKEYQYIIRILEEPVEKPRSIMYKARILSAEKQINSDVQNKKIIIYLPKQQAKESFFLPGQSIHIKANLTKPKQFSQSKFDYPLYLRKQSIAATGFIKENDWKLIDIPIPCYEKLKYQALAIRRSLLKQLQIIIPDKDSYALASALMFGYKNDLDKNLKEKFANVGAGHILAISGLHFNVVFGILFYFFSFMNVSPKGRLFRLLIVLPLIWGFAFMTGFSPSVNRAAGMTSIWIIGYTFYYRAFSLNSTAATAFLMLLFNPLLLYNISFQLSFLAVIAIIILNPLSNKIYSSENKILNYTWNIIYISLAAQIGVLPLSIYYFHHIPTLFLLTNILLIPLTSLILCLIPLSLLISIYFQDAIILNKVLELMIHLITWLNSIPYSSISEIYIDSFQTLSLYLAFILCGIGISKKQVLWFYLLFLLALVNGLYYLC